MTTFRFEVLQRRDSSAEEWLDRWSQLSPPKEEERYRELIAGSAALSREYIVRVGKWKDSAESSGRWQANIASVAYPIWIAAAEAVSECPCDSDVPQFLQLWAGKTYTDKYEAKGKAVKKRFGMSRTTTLLHFISAGRYPIVDARVQTALGRLARVAVPDLAPTSYLEFYCPLMDRIAAECGVENNRRRLDNALFYYGAWDPKKFRL